MVLANGLLYVANGAKSQSTGAGLQFAEFRHVVHLCRDPDRPNLSKKGHFQTGIAHPFGIAFNGTSCFISNQDTNVVSQVNVSNNGLTGSLVQGPPDYLKGLVCHRHFSGRHLCGVAGRHSQRRECHYDRGGSCPRRTRASLDNGKVKNSVRDVAIANGILLVCDEPENVVNLYSLTDGSYLGSSNALADGPTHLAINNGGLYVSAGSTLYWGQLPPSTSSASLTLQTITPTPLLRESKSVESRSTAHRPFTFRISKASAATTRVARSTATV